ncbi:MAG: hypothetical protein ACF8XB_25235 [Planctomycetota bacterium JB042]
MHGAHEHGTFDDARRDSLRRTPWLFASVVFHGVVFLIAAQFPWSVARDRADDARIVSEAPPPVDPIDPPEPPEPVEPRTVDTLEPIELPEVAETPVEADVPNPETALALSPLAAPFDANRSNDVLGVGGGAGGPRGGGSGRRRIERRNGRANETVDRGLEWLARHQDPRGHWSSAGFSDMCETNRCDGEGSAMHDVGVTGLALLAFLGSGHHPDHGRYRTNVSRGLRWLADRQDAETGCFGEPNAHEQFLYDHLLASLAMTEAYGMCRRPTLAPIAQKGVNFVHATRNPYRGWRYAWPPNGQSDLSVTGWAILALKSAKEFGLRVDEAAFDGTRHLLDELTDDATGRTGYLRRGGYSAREPGMEERWPHEKTEAMTAVAVLCRAMLGEDPDRSPAMRAGADLLRKQLPLFDPAEGTIDYYYWYYGSYAMWQMGGRDWDTWQRKMLDAVVETQRHDSDERGSWDPQFDPWGHRGGRVYATAIMTLCLEVYFRYDRVVGSR